MALTCWVLAGNALLHAEGPPVPTIHIPSPGVRFSLVAIAPHAGDVTVVDESGQPLHLQKSPMLDAADIASIYRIIDEDGLPVIDIYFKPERKAKIARATADNVGRQVAVTVGTQVIVVAAIRSPFSVSMRLSGMAGTADVEKKFLALTGTSAPQGSSKKSPPH